MWSILRIFRAIGWYQYPRWTSPNIPRPMRDSGWSSLIVSYWMTQSIHELVRLKWIPMMTTEGTYVFAVPPWWPSVSFKPMIVTVSTADAVSFVVISKWRRYSRVLEQWIYITSVQHTLCRFPFPQQIFHCVALTWIELIELWGPIVFSSLLIESIGLSLEINVLEHFRHLVLEKNIRNVPVLVWIFHRYSWHFGNVGECECSLANGRVPMTMWPRRRSGAKSRRWSGRSWALSRTGWVEPVMAAWVLNVTVRVRGGDLVPRCSSGGAQCHIAHIDEPIGPANVTMSIGRGQSVMGILILCNVKWY